MNFASSTIMPLLARLVIAAAMLTSGWINCFGQVQIRQEVANGLQEMDIAVLANQFAPPTPVEDSKSKPESDVGSEGSVPADEEAELLSPSTAAQVTTTKGVHRISWRLHTKWPSLGGWGTFIAWSAAIAQLVTGILILIGFYTRIAALGTALVLVGATYLVSADVHGMFKMNPFDWPLDSYSFIQLFAGLGLATLALGLVCSGAGGLSLDHRHSANPVSQNKPTKKSGE